MNRRRPILAWLFLALAAGEALGAAERGGAATHHPGRGAAVSVAAQQEGSLLVEAATYRALLGKDGNLHSLRVGGVEMLDDRVAISLGSFFYADAPRVLDRMTQQGATLVDATDGTYSVRYRFLSEEIRIILTNSGTGPVPYFAVLAPKVAIATNLRTSEAAAAPANEQWGEVRFGTESGAYVDLVGGTRIWGPWLGRQVWEVSAIPAGGRREIRVRAGLGEPPKPTLEQLVGMRIKVNSDDALVSAGEPIEMEASVDNRSERTLKGLLSLELSGSRSRLTIYSSSPLELPAKKVTKTRVQWRVSKPDFYSARATLSTERREIAKTRVTAGYRVPEIEAPVKQPQGFREFWDRFLAEIGEAPPQFRMALDQRQSRRRVNVWVAQYESVGGRTIYGWYLVPRGSGRSPAILYLSGYGARPIAPPVALAGHGYVVLAIDVRGNRVDKLRGPSVDTYATDGIEYPERYVYREIVGHALQGLHLLRARGEVDPDRIAVVGVSEGGGLALLLGALRNDIRAVAADAPMLCDFPLSVESAAWPYTEIASYMSEKPTMRSQMEATLAHFDVANFAPNIKCPVLLSVGLLDPVSLPAAVYGCANRLGGAKEVKVLPHAGHEGGGGELWEYKLEWLAKTLGRPSVP
ncbi:MAG: acetylxylan esterase [Armatimonadota bacterium]|nr:MAG: acetylxylan esterase [Armatimonadota bacterium]